MKKINTLKASMFNKKASKSKNKANLIVKTLSPVHKQNIADIGAGGGHFSMMFAESVGNEGMVYSVDVNQGFLDFIEEKATERGITNIKAVLAKKNVLNLPNNGIDLVFIRNVYHHLPDRVNYFKELAEYLSKDGRIVIIDYKNPGFSFISIFGHYTSEKIIIDEMEAAGYHVDEQHDFLPEQSFLVFKRSKYRRIELD
ncbi:MAG: class I SAM-dependent methyltransferase [Candidatus Hodarchaeales archaeon]|jgi:ubiquinone/menaquinone biosynthesis C-methylase UbiE